MLPIKISMWRKQTKFCHANKFPSKLLCHKNQSHIRPLRMVVRVREDPSHIFSCPIMIYKFFSVSQHIIIRLFYRLFYFLFSPPIIWDYFSKILRNFLWKSVFPLNCKSLIADNLSVTLTFHRLNFISAGRPSRPNEIRLKSKMIILWFSIFELFKIGFRAQNFQIHKK